MSNIIRIGGGGDLDQIQFTQNGDYYAEDYGIDGFYACYVRVNPALDQIKFTEDGEYYASSYGIDGFDKVIVATSEGEGKHGGINATEFELINSTCVIS